MIYKVINGKKVIVADVSEVQTQTDWNQANSEAIDYIRNKPSILKIGPGAGDAAAGNHTHYKASIGHTPGSNANVVNINKLHEVYPEGGTFFIQAQEISYVDQLVTGRNLTGRVGGRDTWITRDPDADAIFTPLDKDYSWCILNVSRVYAGNTEYGTLDNDPASDHYGERYGIRILQEMYSDLEPKKGCIRIGSSYYSASSLPYDGVPTASGGREIFRDWRDVIWTEILSDENPKLYRVGGIGGNADSTGTGAGARTIIQDRVHHYTFGANSATISATNCIQLALDESLILGIARTATDRYHFFLSNYGSKTTYNASLQAKIERSATAWFNEVVIPPTIKTLRRGLLTTGTWGLTLNAAAAGGTAQFHVAADLFMGNTTTISTSNGIQVRADDILELEIVKNPTLPMATVAELTRKRKAYKVSMHWISTTEMAIKIEKIY